jgi:SAM-dependent methyltransferase
MTISSEEQIDFWDNWHDKISRRFPAWGKNFPFAEEFLNIIPRGECGSILDLGCGQCNDSIYFAKNDFEVYSIDFSPVALNKARSLIEANALKNIHVMEHDFSQSIPFADNTFMAVYSHLSLHYFDDQTTKQVFDNIWKVLVPNGVLGFCVKSIRDFRYGEGKEIGADMFDHEGHIRHFFRTEYIEELLRDKWKILVIEEYQEKYGGSIEESSFIKTIAQKLPNT